MSERKIKKCLICGKDLTGTPQNKICLNKDCIEKWNKLKYSQKEFKHTCKRCGKEFSTIGCGEKRVLCDTCRLLKKVYNYKLTTQCVVCRQCGNLLYTQIKKGINVLPQIVGKTCDKCKELNRIKLSNKMKLNNPAYHGKILTCDEYNLIQINKELYKSKKEERKIINKLKMSEKMKLNNPMKNPDIAKKVGNTIRNNIKNGKIKYKRGIERKGFKGTRTIMQYFRFCLKNWRKTNLLRANYTCENCGKCGGILHVHHKVPLYKIIENIANKLDIDLSTLVYGSKDYLKIEQLMLDYHNDNNIGLVVCPKCHQIVDKCYHLGKGKGEYKNEIKENK